MGGDSTYPTSFLCRKIFHFPCVPPPLLNTHLYTNSPSYEERLLSSDPSVPPLSLKECEEMMARLKEKYPEEYIIYSLSSVAVAMVFPLVKIYLQVIVDY